MTFCHECGLAIESTILEREVYENSRFHLKPFHITCVDNRFRPEQYRVCDTCHKTGKDEEGHYPSNYHNPNIQHPTCVDWDDVRKYG